MENNNISSIYIKESLAREIFANIAEKWAAMIIVALHQENVLRFNQLKQTCSGVSQKMLTQNLRKLERDGIVKRTIYANEVPLRVEYELTKMGKSVAPNISELMLWTEDNINKIEKKRKKYDKKNNT